MSLNLGIFWLKVMWDSQIWTGLWILEMVLFLKICNIKNLQLLKYSSRRLCFQPFEMRWISKKKTQRRRSMLDSTVIWCIKSYKKLHRSKLFSSWNSTMIWERIKQYQKMVPLNQVNNLTYIYHSKDKDFHHSSKK